MNCQTCGSPMKIVPAGISKSTGKPYNSFLSCPNRCPKTPQNNQPVYLPNTGQPSPNYSPQGSFKPPMATPKTDWDAISTGKVRHGVAIEAIKKDMPLNTSTKVWIDSWVKYIMTGNIQSQPPIDEDININEVPF